MVLVAELVSVTRKPLAGRSKMDTAFRSPLVQTRRDESLDFASLIPESHILGDLGDASSLWQGWNDSPAVTVWVFLTQC